MPDPDVLALADAIDSELRAVGTPERAEHERRYLKSTIDHYGATVWQTRRIVREQVGRATVPTDRRAALELVRTLWAPPAAGSSPVSAAAVFDRPVFDRRRAAVEVLDLYADTLEVSDLPVVESLIRESHTWALVDDLAGDVTGRLAIRLPAAVGAVLDRWSLDADFWVRRSSLLALLPAIRANADVPGLDASHRLDPDGRLDPYGRLERYADAMLGEKEFFIRKAIGWVLREAGKRQPEWVASYVASRQDRMAGLTRREAVKYLP